MTVRNELFKIASNSFFVSGLTSLFHSANQVVVALFWTVPLLYLLLKFDMFVINNSQLMLHRNIKNIFIVLLSFSIRVLGRTLNTSISIPIRNHTTILVSVRPLAV
jgi:hypothetical protein